MTKSIIILGSTGSIGKSTLASISKNKNYKIKLLTTKKNVSKVLEQALKFKVKHVIVFDKKKFEKSKKLFKEKKINLFSDLSNLNKIFKHKVDYSINAISGIDGLEPNLQIIPFSKNILIANKESIVCGWDLIYKCLNKYKTNFIPLDSEHFSIWKLINNEPKQNIKKIILTASGGPFLNKSANKLKNIRPKLALNHPNWKMGKKISIDSSTMMNKLFEFIEAKKIFNLKKKNISILIHPSSFVHAIVFLNNGLIKLLAHETKMIIPISSALGINNFLTDNILKKNIIKLNNLNFSKPNINQFPVLSLIKILPEKSTYFETILITLNDSLVNKYLQGSINYISIQKNLIKLIKNPYFKKYYKLKPKNIYDIKNMISITKSYLNLKIKLYNE